MKRSESPIVEFSVFFIFYRISIKFSRLSVLHRQMSTDVVLAVCENEMFCLSLQTEKFNIISLNSATL